MGFKSSRWVFPILMLAVLPLCAASASAQMMGSHMGSMMMGGGMNGMGGMHELMEWMNGAQLHIVPTHPEPKLDAAMRERGKRLYRVHCAVCHGANGDGNGPRASELSPRPTDFTKGVYEFRSTPSGTLPTDEDIWKVISNGLHGTAMLPWVSLSQNQRWALVAYIEGFSPRFATEPRGKPVSVPEPPPQTRELAEEGKPIYLKDCAGCHGVTGEGNGPMLKKTKGVKPRDFAHGLFKRGSSMHDIYLTLHTGLNGTPMTSFADILTPAQSWAVAAYVRTLIVRPSRSAGGMMGGGMMGGGMMGGGMMGNVAADKQERLGIEQQRLGMEIDMPGMHMGGAER